MKKNSKIATSIALSKLLSISLSFLILTQSFGIISNDLFQIDDFFEHMQFHKEQHGDTIFEFVSKHYGELKADHEKEHQEEKEEHEQLPFKQLSQVFSITVFMGKMFNEKLKTPEFSVLKKHNFFYKVSISSLYSKEIFQPPKFLK